MKEWCINDSKSTTLLIGQVTLLKGSIEKWKEVIELIRETFDRNAYDIFESEEKVHVGDYCLTVLSYSNSYLSTDTDNSKDNLMILFKSYLELSPFYKNLVECWEELQEEVELLSQELGYSASVQLDDYKIKIVEDHLKWKSSKGSSLDKMLQQIKLTKKSRPDKRHIFTLIHPENVLDENELNLLNDALQNQKDYFIIVSDFVFDGVANSIYNKRIINHLLVLRKKEQLTTLLPFVFQEKEFDISLKWYRDVVDKSNGRIIDLSLSSVDNFQHFIYVFLMVYLTQIPFIVDYIGIPEEYKQFIESIIESEV